ncbi:aminoglycoside phosphotransferase family protein [Nocardia sp. NPDC052001]|uniref:aminoglycoside phosphotransferase family protein n=1 Tax=Nocardia sp. NPDC052001 TaxID=3154853 RepID=UPI00342BD879
MKFDPKSTEAVMTEACLKVGIESRDSSLIRLGENAIYRLNKERAVVRIGRSLESSQKELSVAQWLMDNSFPGTEPLEKAPDIEIIDGLPVSFWKLIEESGSPVTSNDLGYVLKSFHELPEPSEPFLPEFTIMPKVVPRIIGLRDRFSVETIDFLLSLHGEIENEYSGLHSILGCGPLHGDAHIGNLMRDSADILRLIDYGDTCIGPREWDVCVLAVAYRVGTAKRETYEEFADAYGFDALNWDGFSIVQAIRELNMTTWLMQLIGQSSTVDVEIEKRIDDLRLGRKRCWEPF